MENDQDDNLDKEIARAKKIKGKKSKKKESENNNENDNPEKKEKKKKKKDKNLKTSDETLAQVSAAQDIQKTLGGMSDINRIPLEGTQSPLESNLQQTESNNDTNIQTKLNDQEIIQQQNESIQPISANRNKIIDDLQNQIADTLKMHEDRDLTRQKMKIVINTIEIAHLPNVHRFVKNKPWIKAQYGRSYAWVADYNGYGTGGQASWSDLQWVFNVEQEEADRQDLVIAICSKDVIIGKYVFSKEEFSEIPMVDGTSIFSMSGELINGAGVAGSIEILCNRSFSDEKTNNVSFGYGKDMHDELAVETISGPLTQQFSSIYSHPQVFLRVVSVAVMDLKQIHFLEPDSPMVTLDTFEWLAMTDIVHHGGVAAGWTNLQWKFAVKKDYGLTVTATSNNKFVGKCLFTTEEILIMKPIKHIGTVPMVSLIKTLTNGREITGKVKINALINHPDDVYLPPAEISKVINENAEQSLALIINENEENLVDSEMDQHNLNDSEEKDQMSPSKFKATEEIYPPLDIIKEPPFTIHISEITVLDIHTPTWQRLLGKTNIKLHIACGAWGASTPSIGVGGSKYAHWLGMKWKIPIVANNYKLRCTLWSSNLSIGAATLTIEELLDMPTSRTSKTEIFAKIFNDKNEISGKVRIICRYTRGVSADNLKPALASLQPSSPSQMNSTFRPSSANDIDAKRSHSPLQSAVLPNQMSMELPEEVRFPIEAQLQKISLLDLMAVHPLRRNNARITFTCDRKTAATKDLKNVGTIAEYKDLNWSMLIRADSKIKMEVDSRGTTVGKVEIFPHSLLEHPMIKFGMSEINVILKNNEATTGKAILTFKVKSAPINPFEDEFGADDTRGTYNHYNSTEGPVMITDKKSESPIKKRLANSLSHDSILPHIKNNAYYETPTAVHPGDLQQQRPMSGLSFGNNYRFDPNQLHSQQVLDNPYVFFNIIVQEIDLFELKQIHSLAKNSPMISAACGKWGSNSTELPNAGASGFWTNLNWRVMMKDEKIKLRLTVFSRGKVLGAAQFSLAQLLKEHITGNNKQQQSSYTGVLAEDFQGLRRIQAVIKNGQDEMGLMKVAYVIDIVQKQHPAALIEEEAEMKMRKFNSSPPSVTQQQVMIQPKHHSPPSVRVPVQQPPSVISNLSHNSPTTNMNRDTQWSVNGTSVRQPFQLNINTNPQGNAQINGSKVRPENRSMMDDDPYSHELAYNQKNSNYIPHSMNDAVYFPCTCIINELKLMELLDLDRSSIIQGGVIAKTSSTWSSGSVRHANISIKLQCGNFYRKLQSSYESGEFTFKNLNWSISVDMDYFIDIIICTNNDKKELGKLKISMRDLAQLPAGSLGYREALLMLSMKGLTIGKMLLKVAFTKTAESNQLRSQLGNQSLSVHNQSYISQPNHGYHGRMSPGDENMLLGSMLDQSYISYHEKNTVNSNVRNDVAYSTRPDQLQVQTPPTHARELLNREIVSNNSSRHRPNSTENITKVTNRPPPLPLHSMNNNSSGQVDSGMNNNEHNNAYGSNNSVVTNAFPSYAAGAVHTDFSEKRDIAAANNGANSSRPLSSQRMLQHSGRQSLHSNLTDNTNFNNNNVSQNLTNNINYGESNNIDEYSPLSIEEVGGLRVSAISLIEMPRIHTFASNQPQCAIACGKHTLNTDASNGSNGSTAQWQDLDYEFLFDQKAMLRVLVSSRDQPIGYVNFTKEALANAKPVQGNTQMILGSLMNANGKATGKVTALFQLLPKDHIPSEI